MSSEVPGFKPKRKVSELCFAVPSLWLATYLRCKQGHGASPSMTQMNCGARKWRGKCGATHTKSGLSGVLAWILGQIVSETHRTSIAGLLKTTRS